MMFTGRIKVGHMVSVAPAPWQMDSSSRSSSARSLAGQAILSQSTRGRGIPMCFVTRKIAIRQCILMVAPTLWGVGDDRRYMQPIGAAAGLEYRIRHA